MGNRLKTDISLISNSLIWSISTAGKLDLSFRFRRNAIAGGRAIPPSANSPQHVAVARGSGALQNQRATHPPISANDEGDLDFHSCSGREQERIRRGQSFRLLSVFAAQGRIRVRDVAKLGSAPEKFPDLMFAPVQGGLAQPSRWIMQRNVAGGGNCKHQNPRPDATNHSEQSPAAPVGRVLFVYRQAEQINESVHSSTFVPTNRIQEAA